MSVRACILGALLLGGCAAPVRLGRFTDNGGFDLSRDHYRVLPGASGGVLPSSWIIDNFQLQDGEAENLKWTDEYTRTVAPDMNDDGRPDRSIVLPRYDLAYTQGSDGASLRLQTTPIGSRLAARDLEVIAHDFVDRVGGGSYITIEWGGRGRARTARGDPDPRRRASVCRRRAGVLGDVRDHLSRSA
jgi:hypothetical protein